MPRPEDILKSCGSLVRLSESRTSTGERVKGRTFSIAHASVDDFLRQGCIRIGSAKEFFFTYGTAHREIAEICLVYILNIIDSEVPLDGDLLTHYPFALRSANLWIHYCFRAFRDKSQDLTRVRRLITRLLESPKGILMWTLLCANTFPFKDVTRFQFCLEINSCSCHMLKMGKISEEHLLVKLSRSDEETKKLAEKYVGPGIEDLIEKCMKSGGKVEL